MLKHYSVQDVLGLKDFFMVTGVRDYIMEHAESREAGVNAVAEYINKQWLVGHLHDLDSLTNRLIRQGHHPEDLLLSLAEAWVNNSDSFSLPNRNIIERWGKSRIALIISILFAFVISITVLFYLNWLDQTNVAYFFVTAGFFTAALIYVFYEVVMYVWQKCVKTNP